MPLVVLSGLAMPSEYEQTSSSSFCNEMHRSSQKVFKSQNELPVLRYNSKFIFYKMELRLTSRPQVPP